MIDVITYCADTSILAAELEAAGYDSIPLDKTPTVVNAAGESMALCRVTEEQLEAMAGYSIQVLGTYDEVFADPDLRAIYDRVYPRTPITWTDEDGTEHTYTPPLMFGVFA